jgi:thiamine transport system permease protein
VKITAGSAIVLVLFLLSPLLIVLFHISNFRTTDFDEFFWAVRQTTIQALGSAIFSITLGFVMSIGLMTTPVKIRNHMSAVSLIPSLMPALLSILIVLVVVRPLPIGIIGIIITHTFIFSGFVAYQFFQLIKDKALGLLDVSYVFGASRLQVYSQLIRMLWPEITSLLFVIFTISFASFSVPIAIGGGRGTTLEVLIYEKIRLAGNWGEAIGISIFQISILMLLSLFQSRKSFSVQRSQTISQKVFKFFGNLPSFIVLSLYILTMLSAAVIFSIRGFFKISEMPGIFSAALSTMPLTLILALITALIVMTLLLASSFLYKVKWLQIFLRGLVAPSLSLIGFSVILLNTDNSVVQSLYYALGFSIFVFPALFRFGFEANLLGIATQIEIAETLGASNFLIFKDIIFPQLLPSATRMGGLAAVWLIGDFALSKYVFTDEKVIGQVIYSLMNSFRVDQAMAIMTLNLLIGFIVFYFFIRISDVVSKKS